MGSGAGVGTSGSSSSHVGLIAGVNVRVVSTVGLDRTLLHTM